MKEIKVQSKRILENREQSRPSSELEQIIKDLRAGKQLREKKESRDRRKQMRQKQEKDMER